MFQNVRCDCRQTLWLVKVWARFRKDLKFLVGFLSSRLERNVYRKIDKSASSGLASGLIAVRPRQPICGRRIRQWRGTRGSRIVPAEEVVNSA